MKNCSRKLLFVGVAGVLILVVLSTVLLRYARPGVSLSLKELNGTGKEHFAMLVLTNGTWKTLSVQYYLADGEGMPEYLVKFEKNRTWSLPAPAEKPLGLKTTFGTFVSIQPHTDLVLKVPIDSLPRQFGIAVSEDVYQVTGFQQRILRLEDWIRGALRLPIRSGTIVWCPTVIKVGDIAH